MCVYISVFENIIGIKHRAAGKLIVRAQAASSYYPPVTLYCQHIWHITSPMIWSSTNTQEWLRGSVRFKIPFFAFISQAFRFLCWFSFKKCKTKKQKQSIISIGRATESGNIYSWGHNLNLTFYTSCLPINGMITPIVQTCIYGLLVEVT